MCGFVVELRSDGTTPSLQRLHSMGASLRHRGPDDAGNYVQGAVGFSHRRLAVIDPSERSAQPMVDEARGLALVYNGALYNYADLRTELQALGYRFRSGGDTEVVLEAYHAWGPRCVERFNGMFAFVVHERATGRLFAARDRLGIKPLYYAAVPRGLRLASTTQALLAGGDVDVAIDPIALHHYMSLHAIVPAPRTLLRGIRKLAPAHVMTVEPDGRIETREYWTPDFTPDEAPGPDQWAERITSVLRTAVARRRVADVPVGILLSGGLDSSLLVALCDRPDEPLHTFSIGFDGIGSIPGDEFEFSTAVSNLFSTEHHRYRFSAEQIVRALDGCVAAMSEPMVSHDNVAFFLLASEVSHHVKVVQTGQGADELFAGYHWYPPLMHSVDPVGDYARVFFDRDHVEYGEAVAPALHVDDVTRAFVEEHFARPGASAAVDKALRLDATTMLCDDPVKRVDNMTMAWGVEARVPFLDHELVELAARIPARYKVGHGGKAILKQAARPLLPAQIVDRPKGYFPVPALTHLQGPVLERVRETVTSARARQRGLFQSTYVERLLQSPHRHHTPMQGSKLWQIGLLEMWLQAHGL